MKAPFSSAEIALHNAITDAVEAHTHDHNLATAIADQVVAGAFVPALLAALEEVVNVIGLNLDKTPHERLVLERARAVIAKAENYL